MIANPAIEQMSREDMSELQLKKLQKRIEWAMEKSAFYYRKFTDAGISSKDIKSLEDMAKLPFTTLDELQNVSIYNLLTLPLSAVLRISRLGYNNSFIKMYTNGDLAYQIEMMTRVLVAQGLNGAAVAGLLGEASDSRLMDVQYALENMGVTVVLLGNNPENIRELMTTCHVDVLISDFKQVMQLVVMLQASNISADDLFLPKIICMEEGLQNPNHIYIEQRLQAETAMVYNSPALGCGGIMFPCQEGEGFHIQEDYFYPEVVEYGTDRVITEPHKAGELVLTPLAAEAMPIFRYRTGQVVMRLDEPCPCGRTLTRLTNPTEYAGVVWQAMP